MWPDCMSDINIDLERHFTFADYQRFTADYHDNECINTFIHVDI